MKENFEINGHIEMYIIFESVFSDVPRNITSIYTLKKLLDETCEEISKILDSKSSKSMNSC